MPVHAVYHCGPPRTSASVKSHGADCNPDAYASSCLRGKDGITRSKEQTGDRMNESIETVILEEGEIRITNRRVIIGTKSYPLADVNSVRIAKVGSTAGCVTAVLMGVGVMLGVLSF